MHVTLRIPQTQQLRCLRLIVYKLYLKILKAYKMKTLEVLAFSCQLQREFLPQRNPFNFSQV